MKYKCGKCGADIADTSLRATAGHELGVATCPHCGSRVARERPRYGAMMACGLVFFAALAAREPFAVGEALYWPLLAVGVVSLGIFLKLAQRAKVLRTVEASDRSP